MLQIFRNPKYDFMRLRGFGYIVSGLLIGSSLALCAWRWSTTGKPLNYGIDFTGGSQFEIKFASVPQLSELRESLDAAGFGHAEVQSFSGDHANAVILRLPENLEANSNLVRQVRLALRPAEERAKEEAGLVDLNTTDPKDLARLLQGTVTSDDAQSLDPLYVTVAEAIVARRAQAADGMFATVADATATDGVNDTMRAVLESKAFVGSMVFLRTESVGPVVGKDLRGKAIVASLVANGLILLYLSMRFELRYGLAAVLCLVHDALVAVGMLALTGREFDLTVLAAILTIIGYSVNDTIVIFDRIRENLKTQKREALVDVINAAVNQTLSRTILTTGATLLVVIPLFLYGGAALNNFAFTLLVGMISGTFSTVFVASPLLLVFSRYFRT